MPDMTFHYFGKGSTDEHIGLVTLNDIEFDTVSEWCSENIPGDWLAMPLYGHEADYLFWFKTDAAITAFRLRFA